MGPLSYLRSIADRNFVIWCIPVYSDTSANEDNSFWNHIR